MVQNAHIHTFCYATEKSRIWEMWRRNSVKIISRAIALNLKICYFNNLFKITYLDTRRAIFHWFLEILYFGSASFHW